MDSDVTRFGWFGRLNYANAQAFAMEQYDEGEPGSSLRLALIAWVPRVLWPSKPIIESGVDLHEKMTGHSGPSFGIGWFAEAYWNGGWTLVVVVSAGIGVFFAFLEAAIIKGVRTGNLWILPLGLLWIRSGLRSDGWVHTEIVGPGVFTLLYLVLLRFWRPGLASSRRRALTPAERPKRSLEPVISPLRRRPT